MSNKIKNTKQSDNDTIHGIIASFLCGVGIENVDVVDLNTAKKIKEMGFNEPTHWYWVDEELPFVKKGIKRVKIGKRRMRHNNYDSFIYAAPTRTEFNKWLNSL